MLNFIFDLSDKIGTSIIESLNSTGDFFLFSLKFFVCFFKKKLKKSELVQQMYLVSVKSIGIIILTGIFAGLALAFQAYVGFSRVNAEEFTGLVATLGIVRELGPVLTGLLTSAKTGSSFTAEIGTMKITEQVDALKTLRIDPISYLIVPRILATIIMMPFVAIITIFFGIFSSYLLCTKVLLINSQSYLSIIEEFLKLNDLMGGLIKSGFFGFLIGWVGTYMGYKTTGGAKEVGKNTTSSVVLSSILILISNYILSSFLYKSGIS